MLRKLAYLPGGTPIVDLSDASIARLARQLDTCHVDTCATFNAPSVSTSVDFQSRTWQAIGAIPCGSVITYGTTA